MIANVEAMTEMQEIERGPFERRSKPRLYEPFPVKVRAVDVNGERFEAETTLDNLSAGGLYVKLKRSVALNAKMFFIIRLSTDAKLDASASQVAVRGIVKRAESQIDGSCGVAILFTQNRFL